MRLFAAQGFHRTTVGEIEGAAGFAPRGGSFYKHFPDKGSILAAVVEHHVDRVRMLRRATELLPLGHADAELTLLLRSLVAELGDEREITAVLEKEGPSLPELRDRFYRDLVEPGYNEAADLLRRSTAGDGGWDADALAVVVIGALVNLRRNEWTFGTTPLDVSAERIIRTVVQLLGAVSGPATA